MILVVGRGYMGTKVAQALSETEDRFTVCSHEKAGAAVLSLKPHFVINCAAMTGERNIDDCEKAKASTIEANTLFPVLLYQECQKVGARLAHFSTACMYYGNKEFSEDDQPNFDKSTYTASKLVADHYLKDKALVFRIRMPFDASTHSRNLLTKLYGYAQTGVLVDSVNSISAAEEMAEVAVKLVLQDAPNGAYHLTNTGAISTKEIVGRMGITGKWVGWDEFYKMGHGPKSFCRLSNAKASSLVPIRDIHDAMDIEARRFRLAA